MLANMYSSLIPKRLKEKVVIIVGHRSMPLEIYNKQANLYNSFVANNSSVLFLILKLIPLSFLSHAQAFALFLASFSIPNSILIVMSSDIVAITLI